MGNSEETFLGSSDGTLVRLRRHGTDKGYVYRILLPQDIGDRTEVTLGTSFGGNVGFIGCEELLLTYGRGVENKEISEVYEAG